MFLYKKNKPRFLLPLETLTYIPNSSSEFTKEKSKNISKRSYIYKKNPALLSLLKTLPTC
jgi:hypothetical protein